MGRKHCNQVNTCLFTMYVAYCFHFRFHCQNETVSPQIFIVSSANSILCKTPLMENNNFLMLQLMSHRSYPSCQVMKTTNVHPGLLWKCGATTLPPIHNYTRCFFRVLFFQYMPTDFYCLCCTMGLRNKSKLCHDELIS